MTGSNVCCGICKDIVIIRDQNSTMVDGQIVHVKCLVKKYEELIREKEKRKTFSGRIRAVLQK